MHARGIDYRVIMVITPDSVGQMAESFAHVLSLGARCIQLNYAIGIPWDQDACAAYAKGLQAIGAQIESVWENGGSLSIINLQELATAVRNNLHVTVDFDGTIYGGNAFLVQAAHRERFALGHVDDGHGWQRDMADGKTDADIFALWRRRASLANTRRVGNVEASFVRFMQARHQGVCVLGGDVRHKEHKRHRTPRPCSSMLTHRPQWTFVVVGVNEWRSNPTLWWTKKLLVMLFMTRRCNLECAYCHMTHDGHPDNELGRLTGMVDHALGAYQRVLLHLFGGEPLLRPDLVQAVLEHVQTQHADRDVEKLITSNGILLRGNALEMLLEHNVGLMLSLDGQFESQKDMRVAHANNERAFGVIVENIRSLVAQNIPFFVNMCVSPQNVDNMFDNARFLAIMGIPRIQIAYEAGRRLDRPTPATLPRAVLSLFVGTAAGLSTSKTIPAVSLSWAVRWPSWMPTATFTVAVPLSWRKTTRRSMRQPGSVDTMSCKTCGGFVQPRIDVVRHFMTHTTDPGDWRRI